MTWKLFLSVLPPGPPVPASAGKPARGPAPPGQVDMPTAQDPGPLQEPLGPVRGAVGRGVSSLLASSNMAATPQCNRTQRGSELPPVDGSYGWGVSSSPVLRTVPTVILMCLSQVGPKVFGPPHLFGNFTSLQKILREGAGKGQDWGFSRGTLTQPGSPDGHM